jgi:hypothetical protein
MPYSINRELWRSPNFSPRTTPIESIVVHSCEGVRPTPRVSSLPWLCKPVSRVSCHYYVCRDADIFQLVDDSNVAWHAGDSLSQFDNGSSIGVECEHRVGMDWPLAQLDALAWLLRQLIARYHLPASRIETHGQIAIAGPYKRKLDPTDWPHESFVRFVAGLYPPKAYRVAGLPVYQRPDRTGPLWGHLFEGDVVAVAADGHLEDERGWVDLAGLVPV